jgi:hypothetical protein
MNKFTDFYEAFHFLNEHYIFMTLEGYKELCRGLKDPLLPSIEENIAFATSMYARYDSCLCVEVHKVNPETSHIDDNEELNTKTEVWFECGYYDGNIYIHDLDLDCGGDTYEEATIELANLVHENYGENSLENINKFFEAKQKEKENA